MVGFRRGLSERVARVPQPPPHFEQRRVPVKQSYRFTGEESGMFLWVLSFAKKVPRLPGRDPALLNYAMLVGFRQRVNYEALAPFILRQAQDERMLTGPR